MNDDIPARKRPRPQPPVKETGTVDDWIDNPSKIVRPRPTAKKVATQEAATRATATSPKDGFTAGSSRTSIQSKQRKSVSGYIEHLPKDDVEDEIDSALEEGRPVDMARAFPYHPSETPTPDRPAAFRTRPMVQPGAKSAPQPEMPPDEERTPAGRLSSVENRFPKYAREYRMSLVHRLTLRGLPLDQIAGMLQVSVRRVQTIRTELHARLREEAMNTDIYSVAGSTMAFYNEVRSTAMRLASDSKATNSQKLNSLRTALAAEADKHRFFQASGYYDAVRFIPENAHNEDRPTKEAQVLQNLMVELLSDDGGKSFHMEGLYDENEDNGTMMLYGRGEPHEHDYEDDEEDD